MIDNSEKDKVVCGHNKWSMGIGKDGAVVVTFSHYPDIGAIGLYDASVEDLRHLGEMFLSAARDAEKELDALNAGTQAKENK